MKHYEVVLHYIDHPSVVKRVHAKNRGHALCLACMDAEANGWPKFANSHKIEELI